MKTITSALKKNRTGNSSEIHRLLNLKSASDEKLIEAMTSLCGINQLLGSLDNEELKFLQLIYTDHDGITFGEIEKAIDIPVEKIEKITSSLSKILLIYPIKNRQLLTKKMDKVYAIEELYQLIRLRNKDSLEDHFRGVISQLCRAIEPFPGLHDIEPEILDFLKIVAENGTVVTLKKTISIFGEEKAEDLVNRAISLDLLKTVQVINPGFTTYLFLNSKIVPHFAESLPDNLNLQKQESENGFKFLVNLLFTYDIISTSGLFLTKQNNYRKIDLKRIAEAQINLRNTDGTIIDSEDAAHLSLNFLARIEALHMNKDIAEISLKDIKDKISNPLKFLVMIIESLGKGEEADTDFPPPFILPEPDDIRIIISALSIKEGTTPGYLETVLKSWKLLQSETGNNGYVFSQDDFIDKYRVAVNFLYITGIIESDGKKITLSETGRAAGELFGQEKKEYPVNEYKGNKCLYINADFSLLIPTEQISAEAVYHLLSHTEIIKEDVILHVRITRSSIINAKKRGMPLENFIDTLKFFSKNQIPQNLNFLLYEWSEQTIEVKVHSAIILKTNQPSLIDEILHSGFSEGVIERISPNHAIINRDYIDEIVKIAKKKDAIISMFEDS